MSNLGNRLRAGGFGILSASSGYFALNNLLERAVANAIASQTQLANAPEITEQVYKTAESLSSGDLYFGLFSAAATGMSLGFCLYYACRKDKE